MNLSVISKILRSYPILFVCGGLTLLGLGLLFMRGPKVAEYEVRQSELEREWKSIQMNVERSAGLDRDINRLEVGLEDVQSRLIDVENVAVNSEFFYELESKTGLTFTQFSQGSANNGEKLPLGLDSFHHFSVVPYDLTITGTMDQILHFTDLLNRQSQIVRLDQIRLSPLVSGSTENRELVSGKLRCHVLAAKHE